MAVLRPAPTTPPTAVAATGGDGGPPAGPVVPLGAAAPGRWTRSVLVTNVVVQVLIVVTGGVVRLTASGLGCPTWPECAPGSFTPVAHQAQGWHKDVEFGNRMLTWVVTAVAVAVLVALWRTRPARPSLRRLAVVPLLCIVAQAVLGGITVLTDLDPAAVAGHFLLSMGIIALSTFVLVRAEEGDGPRRWLVPRPAVAMARVTGAATGAVLVLGTLTTGSGPHSGDASHPSRFGFDPRTISWLHADAVLLLTGLAVGLLVVLAVLPDAPRAAVRRAWWVLGVILAQGALGYTQYALGLPGPLVALHMLGASVLVVAVTALVLSLRERGAVAVLDAGEGLPAQGGS